MRSQFVEEKHRISCGSLEVRLILVLAVARVNMCFSSFWYKSCSCAVVFSRGWGSFPCKLVCIQNLQVIILQNKSIDWIFQSRYWVDVEKKSYSIMFQLEVAMSFVIPFTIWLLAILKRSILLLRLRTSRTYADFNDARLPSLAPGIPAGPGLVFCTGPLRALYICIYPFARSDCFWGSDGHSWIIPFFLEKNTGGKVMDRRVSQSFQTSSGSFRKSTFSKTASLEPCILLLVMVGIQREGILYWARKKAV